MKTTTVPGKTTSIGVRLTPSPSKSIPASAGGASICSAPAKLVAFDSQDWLEHIAFRKQEWGDLNMMVPIALQWADEKICCNEIIEWSVVGSNSPFPDYTPYSVVIGEPNGTSASLYTNDYGTFTVTANVGGSSYQTIIEIWPYASEGWYRGTNLLP